MANYIDFTDSSIVEVIQGAVDDVIAMGDSCTIVYPGIQEACPCTLSEPTQFDDTGNPTINMGICPLCKGSSLRLTHQTDTVTLRVNWNVKNFVSNPYPARVYTQGDYIETLGYLADLPKLTQAQEILVRGANAPYTVSRFVLDSTPVDKHNIVKSRYCYAIWKRLT